MKTLVRLTACSLLLIVSPARAETGLWMTCADTAVADGTRLGLCTQLSYVRPTADSMLATVITTESWGGPDAAWRKYSTLPEGAKGIRCDADIPIAVRFTAGVTAADPCTNTSKVWALLKPVPSADGVERLLTWSAPTQNVDGSALTDLSGYRILLSANPTGPWRQVAAPATSGANMSLRLQALLADRCAQVIARAASGLESAPLMVCLVGSPPVPPTDASLQ